MNIHGLTGNKQFRRKTVSILMAFLMLTGPGVLHLGCSSGDDFLGMEDYQRDLLLFAGAVAIALIADRDNANNDGVGEDQPPGQTAPGQDGLSCWDLNGDGAADPDEDVNDDGFFDAFDCRGLSGESGLSCWDLNGNHIADAAEDLNDDGFFDALDCRASGSSGAEQALEGLSCWDANGNRHADPAEDRNDDGYFDALDCQGADGTDGQNGTNGGTGGTGANGLNCWDTNGNGVASENEDINKDGLFTALDCQPVGLPGEEGGTGLSCWDLNANRVGDASEDIDQDGFFTAMDCRGPTGADGAEGVGGTNGADGADGSDGINGTDGTDGTNGADGNDGFSCWDVNGNGAGDPEEDIDGDGLFTSLDCRGLNGVDGQDGTDGLHCWDLNGNRLGEQNEDIDGDGFFTALDCRGSDGTNGTGGTDGSDGLSCWDVNGNGIGDPGEDIDNDGFFTAADCRGANGIDGADGADGIDGTNGADGINGTDGIEGADGASGVNCWDLNGNGIADPEEDINGDLLVSALDCQGAVGTDGIDGTNGADGTNGTDGTDGADGASGLNCWDLNGNSIADPAEDIDADGYFTAMDCRGAEGADGIHCWDLNENGVADSAEDANGDGIVSVLDCRGGDGTNGDAGGAFFDVFIDDFFTVGNGDYTSLPLGAAVVPELIIEPALGTTSVIAYRVSVPFQYSVGNDIGMRLFFWRQGPVEDCFVARLDAFRTRHGEGVSQYGLTRYIKLNDPTFPDPAGTMVVVDLPLNNAGGTSGGLGLPNDLGSGDFLAFEWNIVPDSLNDPNVSYTMMGVEFYEAPAGSAALQHAVVFGTTDEVDCPFVSECNNNGDCNDGDFCNGSETCSANQQCVPGQAPCQEDQACDAVDESCVNCNAPVHPSKTILCHEPDGQSPHTQIVGHNAANAHLEHGDALGWCPGVCD